MKIFITSDSHFNHKNIIQYSNRPFKSVEEMNEEMIKRWNDKVGKDDLVIHLGDFALGNGQQVQKIKRKLNGTVMLIVGNHDHKITRRAGFMIINGSLRIDKFIFSHRPLPKEEIPVGLTNVHGHIHNKESFNGINVSVEKTDYAPIELNELENMSKNQKS
ncbi:MAG: metallophosphoesterase [Candidatus Pacearchaeota archaeon]|nr:metallophosphoesterase [Candidatus Pacearchaeota archaeon]